MPTVIMVDIQGMIALVPEGSPLLVFPYPRSKGTIKSKILRMGEAFLEGLSPQPPSFGGEVFPDSAS